jgi:ferredoxin-type protein NapG
MGRRRFFRFGLRELLKPLAQAVDAAAEVAEQVANLDTEELTKTSSSTSSSVSLTIRPPDGGTVTRGRASRSVAPLPGPWLRPPGAIEEASFIATCERTGECVRACPAQCIVIDGTNRKGDGRPYVDVDAMPCVVCDGLYCMHACPSGALTPVSLADIDMGTAVWNEATCLRTTGGDDCQICVDDCPIGNVAIELSQEGRGVHVIEAGCIGCGVCQNRCPTSPKSIVVRPRTAHA